MAASVSEPAPTETPPSDAAAMDVPRSGEGACLACGARLVGPHCHDCGQRAHPARTIGASWRASLAADPPGTLRRIGQTLRMLVLQPGALTRRYRDGARSPFVAPAPLALAAFAVLFVVATLVSTSAGPLGSRDPATSMARATADLRAHLAEAEAEPPRADTALERARQDRIERGRSALFFLDQARAAWDPANDPLDVEAQLRRAEGPSLRAQLADPQTLASAIAGAGVTLGWVLLFVMPAALWLLFTNRRRTLTLFDHAVFSAHSLSFAALLGAVVAIAIALGVAPLVLGAVFAAGWAVHGARHLHGAYDLTIAGTAWRLLALGAGIAIALALLATLWIAAGTA